MLSKFYFNKLIIGTANFGQKYGLKKKKLSGKEILKILNYSYKNGIRTIDTAIKYGNSEEIIGKLKRNKWKIISKIPNIPENINNINYFLNNLVQNSKKKLNVKTIDAVLIHNSKNLLDKRGEKIYEALLSLKRKKVINKIGVSIYKFDQINYLIKKFNLDIIQLPFNLIDRRLLNKRLINNLKKKKIEIHVRSIFLQGLLLRNKLPGKFEKWNNIWSKIKILKQKKKIDNLACCIQFIKKYPKINNIVIGIENLKQIEETLNEFKMKRKIIFPNIQCKDEKLINPSLW